MSAKNKWDALENLDKGKLLKTVAKILEGYCEKIETFFKSRIF